jgi:hypothetical protein
LEQRGFIIKFKLKIRKGVFKMTHIKKHSDHDGHHHTASFTRNGHSYKFLHCDSKTHKHAGGQGASKHEGFQQYLLEKDGVKVVGSKPHANHSGHTAVKRAKGASSSVKPKRKLRRSRADSAGGEARQNIKAKQRAASKEAPVENTNPEANSINPTAANAPQPQSNLAQFLAANPNLKAKLLPLDKDGNVSTDTSSGVAIIKQPDGKCVVMGENSSVTFDLETTDPENPTPKDLQMIAARLKSADPAQKLYVGKFVDAQTQPPAASEPATQSPVPQPAGNTPANSNAAPTGTPNNPPLGGPLGGETKIQPTGGAAPTESTTPEVPATPPTVQPAPGGTPADAPAAK